MASMEGPATVPPPVFSGSLGDHPACPRYSGMAIASLALGLLTLLLSYFTALPALILGTIALMRIKQSGGRLKGNGMAWAAIVASALLAPITLVFLWPTGLGHKRGSQMTPCQINLKQIAIAVRMYAMEHDGLCPKTTDVWAGIHVDARALRCPSRTDLPNGYVYNARVAGQAFGSIKNAVPVNGRTTLDETQIWLFADGGERTPAPGCLPNIGYSRADFSVERHNAKKQYQVSFMDGHVETLNRAEYPIEVRPLGVDMKPW
jgi:prepilin-type processing-associated H-X9-DG protein